MSRWNRSGLRMSTITYGNFRKDAGKSLGKLPCKVSGIKSNLKREMKDALRKVIQSIYWLNYPQVSLTECRSKLSEIVGFGFFGQ